MRGRNDQRVTDAEPSKPGDAKMSNQENKNVTLEAVVFKGVKLDKWVEVGPKGGKKTWWRASWARDFQVSPWSHTREQAARSAPGYTGE